MKKATDYAEMLKKSNTDKTLSKVGSAFLAECAELIDLRNAKSDKAILAIFREQDNKWRALCRFVDGLNPNGFQLLVASLSPEIYLALGWCVSEGKL